MISTTQNRAVGKAVRLMVCAALAFAVTSITTQVIVRSAGEHEYGIARTSLAADHSRTDSARRMAVAQAR
jgi:hypothetical protein